MSSRDGPQGEARLAGLAIANPPHYVEQEVARAFAHEVFRGRTPQLERLLRVFDGADIDGRWLALPLSRYAESAHSFADRNLQFIETADRICEEAAASALADAGVNARDITHILTITSTGLATPTLETRFAPRLGVRTSARRIPLWGLGCAGGASGLALAQELSQTPGAMILLVAVELCSLTFIPADASPPNVVASALFGDGAAAAVVTAQEGVDGLRLGLHLEELIPDSREVMGWNLTTEGLQVVFLKQIPGIVQATYRETVGRALNGYGIEIEDLQCLATHPGGRRVIDAQEAALGLPSACFESARLALRRFGNVSSVSVFHVLEELRERSLWNAPGIISAFGPGFTSHVMVLPGKSSCEIDPRAP